LRFKPRLELLEDRTLLSTLIVTNNLDDGSAGSLRDAVRLANLGPGGDTIDFAPSLSGQTIHMNPASGTFALNKGVTITADGLDDMVAIDGVFGGGQQFFTIFTVNSGITVGLDHLTLTNARDYNSGGAITSQGNLTLTNCVVSGNTTSNAGGGIYVAGGSLTLNSCLFTGNSASSGAAIATASNVTVTLTDTTVTGNVGGTALSCTGMVTITGCTIANNTGGGLYATGAVTVTNTTVSGNFGGGGIQASSLVTITNCTISGNRSFSNGGGMVMGGGRLIMTDCAITGNTANNPAGGLDSYAEAFLTNCTVAANTAQGGYAGIINEGGRMTLTNCTVSGNRAEAYSSGGVYNNGQGILALISCTVVGNSTPGYGGGVSNPFGTMTLRNTIVAENTAGSGRPDLWGTVESQGYNLIQNQGDGTITGTTTGNILGQSPRLGPLQDNGGPTQTHAVLPFSPVLDAGDPALAGTTDQRGITRQALPEIGAFEVASPVRFSIDAPANTMAGASFAVTIRTEDVAGNPVTDYTGTVTLTSTDPQAAELGSHTFSAGDAGQFTFDGVVLKTAGGQPQSLIVSDDVVGRSASISVSPAATAAFRLVTPSSVTAGTPFTLSVTAQDAFDNLTPNYRGTVHFSNSDTAGSLPGDYTFTAADNGARSFSIVLRTAASQSLTVTDVQDPNITGTRDNIVVNPAAASRLAVTDFPSPVRAGENGSFTVTALDPFGNVVTSGFNRTIRFSSSDSQATLPADYTFTASDQGLHVFDATLRTAGSQSLTATTTAGPTVTGSQAAIEIDPAAISRFLVAGFPSPVTAGHIDTFTVAAKDAFGNTVPDYVGTVHFSSSDVAATLPHDYTFTLEDGGTRTFGLVLRTAGHQSVTATDVDNGALTGSQDIVVSPAAASALVITNHPSSVTAGDIFTFTVTVVDAFGNTVTGYRGTLHFSSTDGNATLPDNYVFTAADSGRHTFAAILSTPGAQSITVEDTVIPSLRTTVDIEVLG
jgi:hypothetical protein